jgi:P-type Ca2+ transporter type 2C
VLREPLFALLMVAAVIYLLIGDPHDSLALFAFALVSVLISIVQQGRSERMLQALRALSAPRALVVRDGQQQLIAGRDVVVGDLLILSEGVRVPADARLVAGDALLVDESLLTGESVAVQRHAADQSEVWSGTLVLRGTGWAEVTATGARSEIGRIGQTLGSIRTGVPRLQQETRQWVFWFAAGGLVISAAAVVLYGLMVGDWTQALLGGIALSMSMLPEEFPLVMTVFMVMGAWRLSRNRVLTRQASAIETLGSATVLCSDKTGTLTQNRMQLAQLCGADHELLLRTALSACDTPALDPMDRAIVELAAERGVPLAAADALHHFPLQAGRPVVARLWAGRAHGARTVAAKGAPETIASLGHLDAAARMRLLAEVDEMAAAGMRVLAVAVAALPAAGPPLTELETAPLQVLGLLGFIDPLRDGVPEAVAECHAAGIRVAMITGDYPLTARAIAHQAGIRGAVALTGAELQLMDDAALARAVMTHDIYARITPVQKLRIVRALQANGETVAMTGDGVNDAPALKAADIGISMSLRGTDVAREASSLVLLDDNFSSIVQAVRLGRRIYDNLQKAMGYILAIHVPIAGLALAPIVLGAPLVLTPVLIALLEMIIDPTCSIALEAEHGENDVMQRPPRPRAQRILSLRLLLQSLLQGLLALALVGAVFQWARVQQLPPDAIRAVSFAAIVCSVLGLLLVNRSFGSTLRARSRRRWNLPLLVLLTAIVLIIGTLFMLPYTQAFLRLAPLTALQWTVALGTGALLILLLEAAKFLRPRTRAAG